MTAVELVEVINAASIGVVGVIHAIRSPMRRTHVETVSPTTTTVEESHG